jgi:hypothetical protein
MANHIHNLTDDLAGATAGLAQLDEEIRELRIYLTSEKFHQDTTVQVADVLHRLEGLTERVASAQMGGKNASVMGREPTDECIDCAQNFLVSRMIETGGMCDGEPTRRCGRCW